MAEVDLILLIAVLDFVLIGFAIARQKQIANDLATLRKQADAVVSGQQQFIPLIRMISELHARSNG